MRFAMTVLTSIGMGFAGALLVLMVAIGGGESIQPFIALITAWLLSYAFYPPQPSQLPSGDTLETARRRPVGYAVVTAVGLLLLTGITRWYWVRAQRWAATTTASAQLQGRGR